MHNPRFPLIWAATTKQAVNTQGRRITSIPNYGMADAEVYHDFFE